MKLFSSIITLLLTSAAAASKAHDIIAKPHIAKIISKVQSANKDDDVHCMDEVMALFDCLGDECINCFIDIIVDLTEDTTCEDLENSSFCPDMIACITGSCSANDCTTAAEDVESCAATHYPESSGDDDDEMCPGLCEEEKKEHDVVVDETVSKEASSVLVTSKAHVIVAKPHIAKIINDVQEADSGDDAHCMDEVEDILECLGATCVQCFVDIVEDLEEDVTCEELENSNFCEDVMQCIPSCVANDCDEEADDLLDCAEKHYPEESKAEPECPDLCMEANKAFAIA